MNYDDMNLFQFQKLFSTEKVCENYLFKIKWLNGFRCEKCGYTHYFITSTRKLNLYECAECGYQSTVTVGTMLAKEIDVTYKTAWLMLHKIRHVMDKRDEMYDLSGIIKLDDAYFGAPSEGGKRGRGTIQFALLLYY